MHLVILRRLNAGNFETLAVVPRELRFEDQATLGYDPSSRILPALPRVKRGTAISVLSRRGSRPRSIDASRPQAAETGQFEITLACQISDLNWNLD